MKFPQKLGKLALNLMLAGLFTASSHAQILHYNFNDLEKGTETDSTGSNTATATFRNSSGIATNLHGAAGSGISGLPVDLAFDNTASTGMGSAGTGGYAIANIGDAMDNVASFTISGWFKSDTVINNAARLIEQVGGTSNWRVYTEVSGRLSLGVSGSDGTGLVTSAFGNTAYSRTDEWTFFAITYDGTIASNNVKFYVGGLESAVSQVGSTATLNAGILGETADNLAIGGGNVARPYDGFLDDMRIYNATSGNSGVLSLSQLEEVRMAAIPEASTFIPPLFALIFICIGLARRHRR